MLVTIPDSMEHRDLNSFVVTSRISIARLQRLLSKEAIEKPQTQQQQ